MTTKEVTRLKSSMATKLCKLDAIPTSVPKQIAPSIIEIITKIINTSFAHGTDQSVTYHCQRMENSNSTSTSKEVRLCTHTIKLQTSQ